MSLSAVPVYSFTGMLTIPKLITPFHIDRGIALCLLWPARVRAFLAHSSRLGAKKPPKLREAVLNHTPI
jgi:hypothetical protein